MDLKDKFIIVVILFVMIVNVSKAQSISPDFPFASRYENVLDSKIHYIEEYGNNQDPEQLTFLFLHGNPTSSYLWRNIIPYVKDYGRAIAPDLIGMGKSGKPAIDYTFQDHSLYLEKFIEQRQLNNIILVVHDWGSGLGFHYANRHRYKIKGIVFMEAIVRPLGWDEANFFERALFKRFRKQKQGHKMIAENNFFIKKFLFIFGTKRRFTKEEKQQYLAPYPTAESRKPIAVWPKEIPFDGSPDRVYQLVDSYATWLKQSEVPKLLLYAKPGMIIKKNEVERMEKEFTNLSSVYIGKGMHYVQEDHPHEIGKAIEEWVIELFL